MYNSYVVWKYVYNYLKILNFIAVTESATVTLHFVAAAALNSIVNFSSDVVAKNRCYRQNFETELKIICVEFRNCSTSGTTDILAVWGENFSRKYILDLVGNHYCDVIKSAMASQITGVSIVYSFFSGADQRWHPSSASQAFVRGIHRWPVNSPHKGPVTRKMFPFNDVII